MYVPIPARDLQVGDEIRGFGVVVSIEWPTPPAVVACARTSVGTPRWFGIESTQEVRKGGGGA